MENFKFLRGLNEKTHSPHQSIIDRFAHILLLQRKCVQYKETMIRLRFLIITMIVCLIVNCVCIYQNYNYKFSNKIIGNIVLITNGIFVNIFVIKIIDYIREYFKTRKKYRTKLQEVYDI